MAFKLFDAKALNTTAPFNSPSLFLHEACKDHAVEIEYVSGNGTITAVTAKLQGTMDNRGVLDADAHWYDLDTYTFTAGEITAKAAYRTTLNQLTKRIRLQIYSQSGAGTTSTITARYLPNVKV